MPQSEHLPVLNLLTGQKSAFCPLAEKKLWIGSKNGWHLLGWARRALQPCKVWGLTTHHRSFWSKSFYRHRPTFQVWRGSWKVFQGRTFGDCFWDFFTGRTPFLSHNQPCESTDRICQMPSIHKISAGSGVWFRSFVKIVTITHKVSRAFCEAQTINAQTVIELCLQPREWDTNKCDTNKCDRSIDHMNIHITVNSADEQRPGDRLQP